MNIVIFDSSPADVEYTDRIIVWNWDGEFQLDTWHMGVRVSTEFLTEDEFRVQFPITHALRHLWENEVE